MNDKAWHGARKAVSKAAAFVSALGLMTVASCSDWTVPESMGIDSPGLGQQYPELYARYLENLKEYKEGPHKLSVGWFDNSASVPSGQADRLTTLPDSMDAVVLMYPDMVEAWELDEMNEIRNDKATKALYRVDYTTACAAEDMAAWFDSVLPLCQEKGFDGISVLYDPLDLTHLTDDVREQAEALQSAFEARISEWLAANDGKMFILESNYPYLVSDKTILENADYIAIHTESAETIGMLGSMVVRVAENGIPADRLIPMSDPSMNAGPALADVAWWIVESDTDVAGLGICNIGSDYYNADLIYADVRGAITILNPTSNN